MLIVLLIFDSIWSSMIEPKKTKAIDRNFIFSFHSKEFRSYNL